MVNWVGGAIIWLHLRYLELGWDRFVQDMLRERLNNVEVEVIGELLTFHLEVDELVIDLFKLLLVVFEPPLLEKFRDGEVVGARILFPFLMLCIREREEDRREW